MHLKKLEIFGFKSFADKTVLNFESGITAIVGPNGCGKSNIFDAIRWVLGEQSIKELRGSIKEDVIFNGTKDKPSLGFAEVSLTFSNETRMLAIEYDEVTITRKLFRSGESEYLLNKTTVRLKDIQELLMGTGIGAEAYSLIQQGKVDLVVSARPEDRRVIFDEAAGITKYKAKKKEALNKLESTENNLLRVNDITIEVKRQIASIERQANKAKKYKLQFEQLKDLEVKFAARQINSFFDQRNKTNTQLREFKQKESQLNNQLEELDTRLTKNINSLGEIEQKISDVHAEEIKLDGQINLHNRQIGFHQERIEHLNQSDQKLNDKNEQLIGRCRAQQKKIEESRLSLTLLEKSTREDNQILKEKRDSLTTLEKLIRDSRERIKEHEEKILELTHSQVKYRNEHTDIVKELQGTLARKRRLVIENEKVSCERREVNEKLENVQQQINSLKEDINECKNKKEYEIQVIKELRMDLAAVEQSIDHEEKRKLFFNSQKEFIEKMHTQYQDMPDPVVEGRLITQTPPLDHHTGIIGKVKEVIPAGSMYEIICETKFIELDPQQVSQKIEEISQKINSLTEQKENLTVRIQQQGQVCQTIEEAINSKETSYSVLEAQEKDIQEEARKLIEEHKILDSELIREKESLLSVKKKEEELNYQLDTVDQEVGWCQNEIKDRREWIAAHLQEKEKKNVAIAHLEKEIESHKDKVKSQKENQDMFSQDLDHCLEEIKKIKDDVLDQKLKKEQYTEEIETVRKKVEEIEASKESLKSVLTDVEARKSDLGQKINADRADMVVMEEDIEKIKQGTHAQELNEQELVFNEKAIKDGLMRSYKIDFDEISTRNQEETGNAEDETSSTGLWFFEESRAKAREMAMKIRQATDTKPIVNTEEVLDIPSLKEEIEKLKKRCDSFGSVNLVAIEEYEELKQRFEFLTSQQSDLLEAKSQLMSTITKINRSTRQMFMDTFTKVSEEFRIYFRMLFGGGEAQLVLLDPENVLESGIDIIASPPGKKRQNISLLSGGEKTLTAIALIFGVFKVNPSPFCILDEIDAALDDSNVGRFSYLLQDFAKVAQFIVITHNKKTISIADVMYGITMPETGISRIVSVKFSEDQEEKKEKVEEEVLV